MSDVLIDTPEELREQAERCRWLARRTIDPEVVRRLLDMADEFEARADRQADPGDPAKKPPF